MNIVAMASGSGTTLQAMLDAIENKALDARVALVISNKEDAYALERARQAGIDTYVIQAKTDAEMDAELSEVLSKMQADLITLVGYLRKIGSRVCRTYEGRIINTHPSLIPNYCGKGMHGMHVHKAVIAAGEAKSGVTLHYVNEQYDEGDIIRQTEVIVEPGWDAEDLSAAVQRAEKIQLIEELQRLACVWHQRNNVAADLTGCLH